MAQQKFFSGLTEGMINKASAERPDRQKTHFYWPDEYAPCPDDAAPVRHATIPRLHGGVAPPAQSHDPPAAVSGRQHQPSINRVRHQGPATGPGRGPSQPNGQTAYAAGAPPTSDRVLHSVRRSNIQFYDGVDSAFGELERVRANEKRRIEQFLRQQSEEDTGEAARAKRLSTMQSAIEFYDYVDTGGPTRQPPDLHGAVNGWLAIGGGGSSPSVGDDTEENGGSCRSSERSSTTYSGRSSPSGSGRAGQLPEHKRHSQRHLRSSISFHGGDTGAVAATVAAAAAAAAAEDGGATRKPLTVRDSATSRVGVGLPDL
ncbi:uncharacterized protein LOC131214037 [Anopheles bellator]|uniref:uncharacterized protein LOC131214037 n=1 Tax=Anopheles bellator TaxID=139047 RepID=UPI00264765FA|nr:uncharacterized protein LOC131214037 [Anopheles bellator]